MSAPADGQRQVGVLGERVAGDTANLDQDAAAERADGARHGGRALQDLVHAAVEVEPHDVLDVLPAAEQAAAVADLGVARHRADGGVGERLHEVGDGVGLEHGVAVDHDHDLGLGGQHAGAQRGGLAPIGSSDQADVWQPERLDELPGAVGGPVVDHDDFEVGVVGSDQRAHGPLDPDGLVVGRHDDRDRRLEAHGGS